MDKVTLSFEITNIEEDSYVVMDLVPKLLKSLGEMYDYPITDIQIKEIDTNYEEDEDDE